MQALKEVLVAMWQIWVMAVRVIEENFLDDYSVINAEMRRIMENAEDYAKYREANDRLIYGKEKSVTIELSSGPITIYVNH